MIGTTGTQNRRTPPELFAALDAEFRFHVDVAADHENHLCASYLTRYDDALAEGRPWGPPGGVAFCNPPFRMTAAFLAKAREQAAAGRTVVCIVPSNTETDWFRDHVEAVAHECRFLRPRPEFSRPDGTYDPSGPPGTTFAIVYRPGPVRSTAMYQWQWIEGEALKAYRRRVNALRVKRGAA